MFPSAAISSRSHRNRLCCHTPAPTGNSLRWKCNSGYRRSRLACRFGISIGLPLGDHPPARLLTRAQSRPAPALHHRITGISRPSYDRLGKAGTHTGGSPVRDPAWEFPALSYGQLRGRFGTQAPSVSAVISRRGVLAGQHEFSDLLLL